MNRSILHRIFSIAALVICAPALFAQIERGMFLIGGAADMSGSYTGDKKARTDNFRFNFSLSPSVSYFVVKGFAVGGRYTFGLSTSREFYKDKDKYLTPMTVNTSIGPLLRYYLGKKRVKGVGAFSASYVVSTRIFDGGVTNRNGFNVLGSLGAAFFFNPHLSLETAFYLSGSGYKGDLPTTRMGLSIGLFAFLDKKKLE